MTAWLFTQYQAKAEPPSISGINEGISKFESAWHQPWSTPSALQQRIKPTLAIALIASGLFAPVLSEEQINVKLESRWHQPWSEPVRQKIDPKRAIALAASGPFAPVLADDQFTGKIEARWHYPWSEPVRYKINPRLAVVLGASGPFAPVLDDAQLTDKIEARWHFPWSEPVRLPIGLKAQYQQVLAANPGIAQFMDLGFMPWFIPLSEPKRFPVQLITGSQDPFFSEEEPPIDMAVPWFVWLSEPVRTLQGLKAWLQQTTAMPPRLLPTPNVFAAMDATETNYDSAIFGFNVYTSSTSSTSGQGAKVSIVEVANSGGDPVSVRES